MSIRYVEQSGTALAEFIAILMTATLGGMFLSGANELVMIFISLEALSISSYLLTGYTKRDSRSNEAALKYLLMVLPVQQCFCMVSRCCMVYLVDRQN
jgi:NAD(P)H-quinone oxidoreductase subunit 2